LGKSAAIRFDLIFRSIFPFNFYFMSSSPLPTFNFLRGTQILFFPSIPFVSLLHDVRWQTVAFPRQPKEKPVQRAGKTNVGKKETADIPQGEIFSSVRNSSNLPRHGTRCKENPLAANWLLIYLSIYHPPLAPIPLISVICFFSRDVRVILCVLLQHRWNWNSDEITMRCYSPKRGKGVFKYLEWRPTCNEISLLGLEFLSKRVDNRPRFHLSFARRFST